MLLPLVGGVSNVGATAAKEAVFGMDAGPVIMPRPGLVAAVSVAMSALRQTGSCLIRLILNGVAGPAVLCIGGSDNPNPQYAYAELEVPLEFVAGDRLSVETFTLGFAPTTADATILLLCEL